MISILEERTPAQADPVTSLSRQTITTMVAAVRRNEF